MSNEISEELRDFIRKNINSVSLLEVLFLLKKDPSKKWTAEEVSQELRTNPSYALSQLEMLAELQLINIEGKKLYYFNEASSFLDLLQQLESLYTTRRATVINIVYSQPMDNIRSFADAFKIKKGDS